MEEKLKALLEECRSHWTPDYQANITDAQLMGILMAKYFRWSGVDILKACSEGLEDSNFHKENIIIKNLIKYNEER